MMMTTSQLQFLQRISKVEALRSAIHGYVVFHHNLLESSTNHTLIRRRLKITTTKVNPMTMKVEMRMLIVITAAQSEGITMSRVSLKGLQHLEMIKSVVEIIIVNIRRDHHRTCRLTTSLIRHTCNILHISIRDSTLE